MRLKLSHWREGFWVALGQGIIVLATLYLVKVQARYLEPGDYGRLALALTGATLVNQVVMGGLGVAAARYYSIAEERNQLAIFSSSLNTLLWRGVRFVALIGLMALLVGKIMGYGLSTAELLLASLCFAVLSGLNSVYAGIQNAARLRKMAALHGASEAVLKVVCVFLLMSMGGVSGSILLMLGYVLSSGLVFLSHLRFMKRMGHASIAENDDLFTFTADLREYAKPFSRFGGFTWAQQSSDRWALEKFYDLGTVGLYTALYQLSFSPVSVATGFLVTLISPVMFGKSGDGTDDRRVERVRKLGKNMTVACLGLTVLVFVLSFYLSRWWLMLFVSGQYLEVANWLPWLVLMGGLFATGQVLALQLMSEMRPAKMTTVKIATSLLAVVLNVVGSWLDGVAGVIVAGLMFALVYVSWMAYIVYRPADLIVGVEKKIR